MRTTASESPHFLAESANPRSGHHAAPFPPDSDASKCWRRCRGRVHPHDPNTKTVVRERGPNLSSNHRHDPSLPRVGKIASPKYGCHPQAQTSIGHVYESARIEFQGRGVNKSACHSSSLRIVILSSSITLILISNIKYSLFRTALKSHPIVTLKCVLGLDSLQPIQQA